MDYFPCWVYWIHNYTNQTEAFERTTIRTQHAHICINFHYKW